MTKYKVMIDETSHFQDADERFDHGVFENIIDAQEACERIIDESLKELFKPDISADDLLSAYGNFGYDPFIVPLEPGVLQSRFSAWEYAQAQSRRLCKDWHGLVQLESALGHAHQKSGLAPSGVVTTLVNMFRSALSFVLGRDSREERWWIDRYQIALDRGVLPQLPSSFAEFKRDLSGWGYGPTAAAPLEGSIVERWIDLYRARRRIFDIRSADQRRVDTERNTAAMLALKPRYLAMANALVAQVLPDQPATAELLEEFDGRLKSAMGEAAAGYDELIAEGGEPVETWCERQFKFKCNDLLIMLAAQMQVTSRFEHVPIRLLSLVDLARYELWDARRTIEERMWQATDDFPAEKRGELRRQWHEILLRCSTTAGCELLSRFNDNEALAARNLDRVHGIFYAAAEREWARIRKRF
jgi:hypothetical protein